MNEFEVVDVTSLDQMDQAETEHIAILVAGMFGPFHPDVRIRGVYFYDERAPATVYPVINNPFMVAVCLPIHDADNPLARLAHLSHELVHCLTPNGMPPHQATMLEEGLAEHAKVYLTESLYQEQFPTFNFRDMTAGKYQEAFLLVEELVQHCGLEEMRGGIAELRARTGLPFAHLVQTHLIEQFHCAPRHLLLKLSERFH